MKISTYLKAVAVAVPIIASFPAYAQDMPNGNVIAMLGCTLTDGTTMQEAVEYGRNQPRDHTAPGQVYYRVPTIAGNFHNNYDFQVALYYPSFAEMGERNSAMPTREVQRSNERRTNLFTCDPSSQVVVRSRGVNQENDGFTGDETMMTMRFCALNEDSNLADAYTFAQGVARNYSRAGDNSLMQMYDLLIGPRAEMPQSTTVGYISVGATRESMMARLDLTRTGTNALAGLTPPFSRCNFPALWTTHAVFRANPPAGN